MIEVRKAAKHTRNNLETAAATATTIATTTTTTTQVCAMSLHNVSSDWFPFVL
jgi:hypothetical protein